MWHLVLTLFPYWCKISRPCHVPVPNYWTCAKTTPQKKLVFLVKSLKNWGYDFSHRNAGATKIQSRDHIYNVIWVKRFDFVCDVRDRSYEIISFSLILIYFKKPPVAIFADIIKNSTIFNKTTFEDQKKFKRTFIYALKCILHLYFQIY